jgi:hypothetical protein
LIRDQGYLAGLQTTEILLSIVPGGATATYIEDGKYGRAGLAFGSDVVQTVFPLGKLAKLQKLASVTSKVTKVSNVAISAKTIASAMLIVDSLNAGVAIHDTIQDVQKGNKVGAAIGSLDVLFSVLNVGFSAKQLADAAHDARRVVEKAPDAEVPRPKFPDLPIANIQMCFARDTLVATEIGLRPIGEIEPGDLVYGFDFVSGIPVLAEVETRHDNFYDGAVVRLEVNGSWVETTSYHPFWVVEGRDLNERSVPRELDPSEDEGKALRGRWVNSHELRAGDTIHLHDGTSARISRIEQRYEPLLPVSNLTVRGFHTFFVGEASILVHNTAWCIARKRAEELLGPGATELEVRRKMSELYKNFDWQKHIENNGGVDALGRTKAQADAIDMPDQHGHHIEYKKAKTDDDVAAQDLLLAYKIDPMFGKEVLVYAPNNRNGNGHSIAFNKETQDAVKKKVLESKDAQYNDEQIRAEIVVELQRQAERWIDKQWPGYLDNHSIFKKK